jgi:hypothetical protein
MSQKLQLRSRKSEHPGLQTRNPKPETRKKFKFLKNRNGQNSLALRLLNIAAFGFRVCFGIRNSGFGFSGLGASTFGFDLAKSEVWLSGQAPASEPQLRVP